MQPGRVYWNERARNSGGDAARAAGLDDPIANQCIERVQSRVLGAALSQLARRRRLRDAALLDFGCGSGRWIETLGAAGCRYVGVDIAEDMLRIARAGDRARLLLGVDEAALPFGDASFDVIWSVAAVHHNPYEVQERIVAEMVRVLKPDGLVLLFEGIGPRRPDGDTYWPRPLHEWEDLARRHRLECVWRRGARYMVLASAMEKMLQRSQESGVGRRGIDPFWRRATAWIDVRLDPYLAGVLPERLQNRMAMIFRRSGDRSGVGKAHR